MVGIKLSSWPLTWCGPLTGATLQLKSMCLSIRPLVLWSDLLSKFQHLFSTFPLCKGLLSVKLMWPGELHHKFTHTVLSFLPLPVKGCLYLYLTPPAPLHCILPTQGYHSTFICITSVLSIPENAPWQTILCYSPCSKQQQTLQLLFPSNGCHIHLFSSFSDVSWVARVLPPHSLQAISLESTPLRLLSQILNENLFW